MQYWLVAVKSWIVGLRSDGAEVPGLHGGIGDSGGVLIQLPVSESWNS
jgi:hypothetical protein